LGSHFAGHHFGSMWNTRRRAGADDEVYAGPSASSKQAVKSYEGYSREEVEAFLNPSSQSSDPDVAPVFSGLPHSNTPTSNITTNKVPNFWLPLATATLSPETPDLPAAGTTLPTATPNVVPSPTPIWTPTPEAVSVPSPTAISVQPSPTSTATPESTPTSVLTATASPSTVELVKTYQLGQQVIAVDISPDGKIFAAGLSNNRVEIMDVELATSIDRLRDHSSAINDVEFSSDGLRLVTASDDEIGISWIILPQWEIDRSLNGYGDSVNAIIFSPDSTLIATASKDESASLWSVETGERLLKIREHSKSLLTIWHFPPMAQRLPQSPATGVLSSGT
jgi:WD40 repeat protein